MRAAGLGLGLGLLLGGAASAQMPPAIGLIAYGDAPAPGAAICTGALIAPDLVLTAGHCLPPGSAAGHIRFFPGHATTGAIPAHPGAEILRTAAGPSWPGLSGPLAGLAVDLAVLRLASPVTGVTPLALSDTSPPLRGVLFAYDRSAPDQPPAARDCVLVAGWPNVVVRIAGYDCAVVSGNSGAPLLTRTTDGPQIAAITVASGTGAARAFAVVPGAADFPDLPRAD